MIACQILDVTYTSEHYIDVHGMSDNAFDFNVLWLTVKKTPTHWFLIDKSMTLNK